MEERGDCMALEAEEPGSDKTEVPRGATVSAFAPRSMPPCWAFLPAGDAFLLGMPPCWASLSSGIPSPLGFLHRWNSHTA